MTNIDFKKWNKEFKKLTYSKNTFAVFHDFINIFIDQWTIPNQTPLFKNNQQYSPEQLNHLLKLCIILTECMQDNLENNYWCDFLGEWWESEENLTNKTTEQYFTPQDVCTLMSELLLNTPEKLTENPVAMLDCCCGSGRFALAHHEKRPQDWFYLSDIDEIAIKITLVNMIFHNMRGVVAWQNTLTEEVYACWQVTPRLYEFGGLPYIVPYGKDLVNACSCLPRDSKMMDINTDETTKSNTLDSWIK